MTEFKWIKHDGGPMPVPGDTIVAWCNDGLPTAFDESYVGPANQLEGWHNYTHYAIVTPSQSAASATSDKVNSPAHYASRDIECIDAIRAQLTDDEFRGYCKGNVAKYVWRERTKGDVESLEKARWYLDRLISDIRNAD